MERINLKPLKDLKIQIEKMKAQYTFDLNKLNDKYEEEIRKLTDVHSERLKKSGELYDTTNNITLVPIYDDREIDVKKVHIQLENKYHKCAHMSAKDICETFGYNVLEDQIKKDNKKTFEKLATITIKDAKKHLTKRELEDYWLPRKILRYDLDLKIK